MKHISRRHALLLWPAAAAAIELSQVSGRRPGQDPDIQEQDAKLPNGKSQRDEILKLEHQENLKDAARLVEMSRGLQADLEKNDPFVLPLGAIKKTDDIEKLVKKIRARLRH
jgi:hypothetical protein